MTHPVVTEPPESHSTLPGDRRAEPLAALLDLPWTDPEVRDLTAMLLAALDAAQQTGKSELLRDALCFADGRLQVRRLSRAGCAGIGAALETVVTAHLATGDLARVRAVVSEALAGVPAVLAAETDSLGPVATAYVDDLVRGDRASAVAGYAGAWPRAWTSWRSSSTSWNRRSTRSVVGGRSDASPSPRSTSAPP